MYANGLPSTTQSTNTISAVNAAAAPAAGASYGGGYFGGQISTAGNGVADYNLVVAPLASGQFGGSTPTTIQWKTSASADTNPNSQNAVYGKLATDQFTGATYPAFNWAKGLNIGGFTDWYIPAKNELEILYFNLKPGTTANNTSSGINPNAVPPRASAYGATPTRTSNTLFQTGGSEAFFTTNGYWSSSEYSINTISAWRQNFSSGGQSDGNKDTTFYARAIRRVAVTGIGSSQTLSINGANTDGFTVGMAIKGSSSSATGIITAINGTSVTITQTSATNWNNTDKIQGDGTAILGSPFTVTTAPLTSLTVAKPPLAANTTYYARVRYTSQATVVTSPWSGWQKFTTGSLTVNPTTITNAGVTGIPAAVASSSGTYFALPYPWTTNTTVYKSTTGGGSGSWTSIATTVGAAGNLYIACDETGTKVVIAEGAGGTLGWSSSDGGLNWVGGVGSLERVTYGNGVFVGGRGTSLTVINPTTWTSTGTLTSGPGADPGNPGGVVRSLVWTGQNWLATSPGGAGTGFLYRGPNNSNTGTMLNVASGNGLLLLVNGDSPGVVYGVGSAGTKKSTDHGATWTTMGGSGIVGTSPQSLAYGPGCLVFGGPTGMDYWKSTDEGANWTQLPTASITSATGISQWALYNPVFLNFYLSATSAVGKIYS
jgi:hypothetical protein